jgi:broad specificity phosphatase PhoE
MNRLRRLLLVRHGLPDYRVRQAADEPPGPPLSTLGAAQARQAAAELSEFPATTIYCSPLARTRQTAELIHRVLHLPVMVQGELKEWHRTESLYDVSVRSAAWLAHWLAGGEDCAIVVGHASPLLAIIRTALFLPHVAWHRRGQPNLLNLNTCDRFEVSMGSVFALTIEPAQVTAELVAHPEPRIVDVPHRPRRRFPRPVHGHGENECVRRPNFGRLIGDWSGAPSCGD